MYFNKNYFRIGKKTICSIYVHIFVVKSCVVFEIDGEGAKNNPPPPV